MVRPVSLRPRDGHRPGIPEPGRRHGVPDVLYRPGPLLPVRHASDARNDGRTRDRSSVVVRHRRQQRVRARVDGRRDQYLRDRAVLAEAFPDNRWELRYFGGLVPWSFPEVPYSRIDNDRMAGYRDNAEA